MNKILKASHSHFIAQRDLILAELDLNLNKNNSSTSIEKTINLFKDLAISNLCIEYISAIINDNELNDSSRLKDLDFLAKELENKLTNKDINNSENA